MHYDSKQQLELKRETETLWKISLAISYKVKRTLTIWPSNPLLGIYPKEMKYICSHKKSRWENLLQLYS